MVTKLKKVLSLIVCFSLILSISSLSCAKEEKKDIITKKEVTTELVQNFKLGISCNNGSALTEEGPAGWTGFVGNGRSDTGWVSDITHSDPDYFKLYFVQGSYLLSQNLDYRIGVQLCDNGAGNQAGEIRYTPWASEGGGWSAYAGDDNNFDPDYIKIIIETRTTYGYRASNVRFGIQVCDQGNTGREAGGTKFTPWVNSTYSGNTGWASDNNGYNPDAVRVCLNVIG